MKKIFLYILVGSLSFTACKKDDEVATYQEPADIATQDSYDDQSIKKFMDENYLDVQGNIKPFSATDTTDDKEKKLSQLSYKTLPSGTIYIMRDGAQPTTDAQTIKENDIIKLMGRVYTYVGAQTDGNVAFISQTTFLNTINGSGIPTIDPMYYYVKQQVLTAATTTDSQKPSYYQIPGFREALLNFKAFNDIPGGTPYNLQGVIIVPSRAAFARNPHYGYLGISYRNRSFVFNFQIYGRADRPTDQIQK
nr:hypothetical protein [uncultured Chryseobacterium sp.]